MEVIVAKTAGFCFGVKRAVEKVYEQIANGKQPIFTYGPIIHNEEVVRDLSEKGVGVIDTKDELAALKEGVVVIRSHGVGKEIYDILEGNGVEIVDATCPFVKKIHNIVAEQSAAGRQVIIVGDENHPEVQGIRGWGDDKTKVIDSYEEFENLQEAGKAYNIDANGISYWSAHGVFSPNSNGVSLTRGSAETIRCVYDEWYWENSETYRLGVDANGTYRPFNTFTWGDMPRDQFDAKTE